MSDVASALNRIEELEAQNDLCNLEYQKLKADQMQAAKDLKACNQSL